MAAFTSSLKKSLEKNRDLQLELVSALRSLSGKMAENRRMASRLTRELHVENEGSSKPKAFPKGEIDVVKSLLHSVMKEEGKTSADETVDLKKYDKTLTRRKVEEKWSCDPYRPWARQYFVDHLNSVPQHNEDTLKRRSLEETHGAGQFFPHLSPPWMTHERKMLGEAMKEQHQSNANDSVDLEAVAQYVNKKRRVDSREETPRRKPRTAEQCKVQYHRQKVEKQPKISKAETKKIVELMKETQGGKVDWEAVATSIGNQRTSWQCFQAYQKMMHSAPTQPNWTPQQDEILLKYVAAQGPQFVLDMVSVDEMCCKLFPDKTRRQIFLRANQSLVNPTLQSTPWSLQEERKLVLCQKIYKEAPERVAAHFKIRSARSVREKWSRNLDPNYSDEPWSPQDDETLRQVVKQKLEQAKAGGAANQCGGSISWAHIMKEHFPNRRSDVIRNRWIQELATEEEMLQKIKADLATSQLGQHHHHEEPPQLDDYVVKVVGKGKKKRNK